MLLLAYDLSHLFSHNFDTKIIQSKADIALNIINTFNLELNQIFLSSLIISLNKVIIDKHNILWQDYTIYPCCCL